MHNEAVWRNKGDTLVELIRFKEAAECYDKVLELNSQDFCTINSKWIVLIRLEQFDEALKFYNVALELNPHDSYF